MRLAITLSALPLLAGCSTDSIPTPNILSEHIQQPILSGSADYTHTNVVALARTSGRSFGMCTGSLIAPNLVLTARHCISDLPGTYVECGKTLFENTSAPGDVWVSTEQTVNRRDWVGTREVIVPEESNDPCGFDVAMLILDQNITSVGSLTPRIDHKAERGEGFTAVGYGETAQNNGQSGSRRSRDDLEVICAYPQFCSVGVANNEFVADTGICQGDSGGPAIDDQGRVFGVVSRGAQGCEYPAYADVATWKDWIVDAATRAAQLGGYALPQWAATGDSGPPPGSNVEDGGEGNTGGDSSGEDGTGEDTGPGETDTGGEETPATPEGGTGLQGDDCAGGNDCSDGYKCVGGAGATEGLCSQDCGTGAECPAGTHCDATTGSCLGLPATDTPRSDTGGCSVGTVGSVAQGTQGGLFALLGLAGLVMMARRRRGA